MLTLIQFLSTLSLRRATAPPYNLMIQHTNFYPRSPCGERRPASHLSKFNTSYFYPRSPCGERLFEYIQAGTGILFLSTLSLRRATSDVSERESLAEDFYPRSPCGERPQQRHLTKHPQKFLSTLSLRRATRCKLSWNNREVISIHALLAESDSHLLKRCRSMSLFLSTLSLRRAT